MANNDITNHARSIHITHIDHIVELQLIKAALNGYEEFKYSPEKIEFLITFFNEEENLQILYNYENLEKRDAITKLIKWKKSNGDTTFEGLDRPDITKVRKTWNELSKKLVSLDFELFKRRMTQLLDLQHFHIQDSGKYNTEELRLKCKGEKPLKDHVMELQLIVSVMKQIGYQAGQLEAVYLVNFFNNKDNVKIISKTDNINKHLAIERFISNNYNYQGLSAEDKINISSTWKDLKKQLNSQLQLDKFIKEMDKVLEFK